jgi:hypothetical protein
MTKRYQRGNQKPYIEDEQTTQWPKEKVQKDKQLSTKHTHKTKDPVTRTRLKTGCELVFLSLAFARPRTSLPAVRQITPIYNKVQKRIQLECESIYWTDIA